jgi:alpha-methylacyl-CoA racemase
VTTSSRPIEPVPPSGPLRGVRVVDLSRLGPGPFASQILSDFGADVVTVDAPGTPELDASGLYNRGKESVLVDIRQPEGAELVRRLAEGADVFVESARPGAMERRGLGPDVLMARNPALVYTRITGYGQTGPYAQQAGHDINYIAVGGALGVIGSTAEPVPPLNLLGDFASGSLNAVLGIVLALFERSRTGRGQVVDAAMVDAAAVLVSAQVGEWCRPTWQGWRGRGNDILSGAAPFYGVYRCADDKWFAVGAIEQAFYRQFLDALGLADEPVERQLTRSAWPELRERVAAAFRDRPRDEWSAIFGDIDGCGTPVLEIEELPDDPHLRARGTFTPVDGLQEIAPAPRLSASPGQIRPREPGRGRHSRDVLLRAGLGEDEITALVERGVVGEAAPTPESNG